MNEWISQLFPILTWHKWIWYVSVHSYEPILSETRVFVPSVVCFYGKTWWNGIACDDVRWIVKTSCWCQCRLGYKIVWNWNCDIRITLIIYVRKLAIVLFTGQRLLNKSTWFDYNYKYVFLSVLLRHFLHTCNLLFLEDTISCFIIHRSNKHVINKLCHHPSVQ